MWSTGEGVLEDLELQRQVLCALNAVLYEQLQYKGNEGDYYNPLNSYIHQVQPFSSRFSLLFSTENCANGGSAVHPGATSPYRHSHKPLCSLHDAGSEAGGPAGARQLPQSLPAALEPEAERVRRQNRSSTVFLLTVSVPFNLF